MNTLEIGRWIADNNLHWLSVALFVAIFVGMLLFSWIRTGRRPSPWSW